MGWQEPKTNWAANDKCTASDMNRILNNIQYLIDGTSATYTYTSNDVVTVTQWKEIVRDVVGLCVNEGIKYIEPSTKAEYNNFNIVEDLIAKVKLTRDRRQNMYKYNHYAGQNYYTDSEINAGGIY